MRQLQMMGMVVGNAAICYEHNANPGTGTGCCDTDPASFTITRHSLLHRLDTGEYAGYKCSSFPGFL